MFFAENVARFARSGEETMDPFRTRYKKSVALRAVLTAGLPSRAPSVVRLCRSATLLACNPTGARLPFIGVRIEPLPARFPPTRCGSAQACSARTPTLDRRFESREARSASLSPAIGTRAVGKARSAFGEGKAPPRGNRRFSYPDV